MGLLDWIWDGSSVGVKAANRVADTSLQLIPMLLNGYLSGPSEDIRKMLKLAREYGTGELKLVPDNQVFAVTDTLQNLAQSWNEFNAQAGAFESVSWQVGRQFTYEVQRFNDNWEDIQKPLAAAISAFQTIALLAVCAAVLTAVVVIVLAVATAWRFFWRATPHRGSNILFVTSNSQSSSQATVAIGSPTRIRTWTRRCVFGPRWTSLAFKSTCCWVARESTQLQLTNLLTPLVCLRSTAFTVST